MRWAIPRDENNSNWHREAELLRRALLEVNPETEISYETLEGMEIFCVDTKLPKLVDDLESAAMTLWRPWCEKLETALRRLNESEKKLVDDAQEAYGRAAFYKGIAVGLRVLSERSRSGLTAATEARSEPVDHAVQRYCELRGEGKPKGRAQEIVEEKFGVGKRAIQKRLQLLREAHHVRSCARIREK